MKNKGNKKGFTLIELLAVIVVLAIVAVLGAGLVLPALANARKNAFIVEANNAIDAASRAVSYYQIGTLTSAQIDAAGADGIKAKYTYLGNAMAKETFCFTLDSLVDLGVFDKKDLTKSGYSGTIVVTVPKDSNKAYTYTTSMQNNDFYISNADGSIQESEVKQKAGVEANNYSSLKKTC